MTRPWGFLLPFFAFAMLVGTPCSELMGQDAPAVTQVVPAASATPSPEATAEPAATPAMPGPTSAPSPAPIPPASSGPAPAMSGSDSALSGTAPAMSGTMPALSGSTAAAKASPTPPSPYSLEINLQEQRVYLLKNGQKFAESPISSGRAGHLTPTGNFEVIQKDLNHFSNLYGKFVDKESGRVVKSGADSAMPVPKGCKFVPAPMKWFMRFDGAAGMHAGVLPGYPASHGCVRMPASKAQMFYSLVQVGTPVHVFGTTPTRAIHEEREPHHTVASTPHPPPAPTPKPHHGWFW